MTRAWEKEKSESPGRNRTHDLLNTGREAMGSILVGDSDIFLSRARAMLINSPFTFHFRAQNSPSSLTYHYSKSVVVVITTPFIPPRLRCSSKSCSSWIVVVCLISQETRVRLNPRNNLSGSDYINADFVKVKMEYE